MDVTSRAGRKRNHTATLKRKAGILEEIWASGRLLKLDAADARAIWTRMKSEADQNRRLREIREYSGPLKKKEREDLDRNRRKREAATTPEERHKFDAIVISIRKRIRRRIGVVNV